jgi:short-subunit dehydrogenase
LIVPKRIVIIGATSAIAQHCARLWVVEELAHFVLVGRNAEKLEAISQDLRVRKPEATTQVETCEFTDPEAIAQLAKTLRQQGPLDIVLIAHGTLPEQSSCQNDLTLARNAMTINGLSPAYFAEAFAGEMEDQADGSLVVIGSVAGDRGRQSNYVYGAAKGLVERYVQGLEHRLAGSNVTLTLVKPGPTQTPMTAHMEGHEKMASLEQVAGDIIRGVKAKKRVIYTPRKWALIMLVIRNLPPLVFNKMKI